MAIIIRDAIRELFRTGKKPTQTHFWDTYDSFFHKYDQIPKNNITNFHHVESGKLQVFKKPGNTGESLEAGDMIQGYFTETKFVKAIYVEGDVLELASYNLLEELDF